MVKNVKQWLDKQKGGSSFLSILSDFLRTYRNVPHTTTGRTPAELLFGRALRTHISIVLPNTADRVKSYLKPPETIQEPRQFKSGDLVWVRDFRPNARQKWVQGTVLVPVGTLQYNVSIEGSNTRKVHVDQLLKRVSQVVKGIAAGTSNVPITVPREEVSVISVPSTDIVPEDLEDSASATQQQTDAIPAVNTQGDVTTIPESETSEQTHITSNDSSLAVSETSSAMNSVIPSRKSQNLPIHGQQSTRHSARETHVPKRLIEEM